MTSVPNHRQPLNGNRALLLFLFPLTLFSCGAFSETRHTAVVHTTEEWVVEAGPDSSVESEVVESVPEVIESAEETVEFHGVQFRVPIHKRAFEIAVLLPFHTGYKRPDEKVRSDLMYEYLQGIKVALSELEGQGVKYTVKVYDTDNDSILLKRILRKPDLKQVDLIVGPTDKAQVAIAAQFAKENKIPLFSPITLGQVAGESNPYLFNLSPSAHMQALEFVRMWRTVHKGKKLLVVRDGGRFDQSFGAALVAELKAMGLSYQEVPSSRSFSWGAYIKDGRYIVVHTTEDKNTLNAAVTGLMHHKEKVWLMGSYRWMDLSSVDYSFWGQLSVHFICPDLANVGNSQSEAMRHSFRSMYNGDPSSFSQLGYDHMRFACEVLDAFGSHFPRFIADRSLHYSNSGIRLHWADGCYQNQFLGLIAFNEDHSLRIVDIP